ncbi:hypothetical protein [Candidatus Amarobacter glycogenicus]|uniref:hypothetical protein n=1 Tax=Candidatus Amarobacter glycogenicus TaxID=3140699 RepID=UPI00313494EC|nr:hypothetical protein [Dehalococcoidia bacterium]
MAEMGARVQGVAAVGDAHRTGRRPRMPCQPDIVFGYRLVPVEHAQAGQPILQLAGSVDSVGLVTGPQELQEKIAVGRVHHRFTIPQVVP